MVTLNSEIIVNEITAATSTVQVLRVLRTRGKEHADAVVQETTS